MTERSPILLVVASNYDEGRAFIREDLGLRTAFALQRVRIVTSDRALRGWRPGTLLRIAYALNDGPLFHLARALIISGRLKEASRQDLDRLHEEAVG